MHTFDSSEWNHEIALETLQEIEDIARKAVNSTSDIFTLRVEYEIALKEILDLLKTGRTYEVE